jgi:hypothetical protein
MEGKVGRGRENPVSAFSIGKPWEKSRGGRELTGRRQLAGQ